MKIGILTQYYPPEIGAPQARLSLLARAMARAGHEVYVLTAMPNYPTGRMFSGYSGFLKRETLDGVTVLRSWIWPTKSVSLSARLANYFSFVVSSLVAGIFRLPKLDCLLTESPPLFLGISGYLLSRARRARLIFNVSDLWPESAVRLGVIRDGWALRLARRLEAFCYRNAWLVTGQSREIVDDIARRFPETRVYHMSNGVDPGLFSAASSSAALRERLAPGASLIALYAGLHGIAQGLDQVLHAASRLPNGLRLALIGDGPQKQGLIAHARSLGLSNVTFLDPLPHKDMPAVLASADIALITLKGDLPGAVPSKLYEAMAAGLPIVLAASGEPAELLHQAGAGIAVPPGDSIAMASALQQLAEDPALRRRLGEAGRRAANGPFNRNLITAMFLRFLEAACAAPGLPADQAVSASCNASRP